MNLEETLIAKVVDEWLMYCRRYSERTQEQYQYTIPRFVASLPKEVKFISQIHNRHIENYISNLLVSGLKHSTINSHLSCIKSFCRWLSRNYDIPNYAAKVELLKLQPSIQRFLTLTEYQKVLALFGTKKRKQSYPLNDRNYDIFRFLYHTGLRATEFISIKWPDISPDFKMLTVIGKANKRRCVPLNVVCREILERYPPNENRPIFIVNSRRTLHYICHCLAKQAEIPPFGPHALRHLHATEMLRRGAPIAYVSRILGHSSTSFTERLYIHWLPDFNNGWTDRLVE